MTIEMILLAASSGNWFSVMCEVLVLVLIIGSIMVLILENNNPTKTLAWIMALIFLPGIGLIAYFLIGKDYRHKKTISDADREQIVRVPYRNYDEQQLVPSPLPTDHSRVMEMMRRTNHAVPLYGNEVEIYTTFDGMFNALLESIEQATDHIHIQFFKIENDPVGNQLADLLIRKAEQGVDVRLMYDDAANIQVSRQFYKKMSNRGVLVQPFLKLNFPFIGRDVNCRNHRKIVIVDGKVGFTGGMNIAQRYRIGNKHGIWRDTHLRIIGPAVSELQITFLSDWCFANGQLIDGERFFPKVNSKSNSLVQVVGDGPMDRWDVIMQGFVQLIQQSRQYVWIQTPYFMPTEPIITAMCNAALSGIDVRLMIPERGDKGILNPLASRANLETVLEAGVKVYFYKKGFLHAKTIVVDDKVTSIGSTNIDFRSLEQDFECNAFLYDPDLAIRQKNIFLDDANDAISIDLPTWRQRSWWEKFKEGIARLFSPLM